MSTAPKHKTIANDRSVAPENICMLAVIETLSVRQIFVRGPGLKFVLTKTHVVSHPFMTGFCVNSCLLFCYFFTQSVQIFRSLTGPSQKPLIFFIPLPIQRLETHKS